MTGYKSDGSQFPVTTNYVEPSFAGIQGSYIDLPVEQVASKFEFSLAGSGAEYSYAALSEIELFYKLSTSDTRYILCAGVIILKTVDYIVLCTCANKMLIV